MKFTMTSAAVLLSFGASRSSWRGLSLDVDDATVVVGPNASSKSNVGRLINLVLAVLRGCAQPTQHCWRSWPRRRSPRVVE